MTRYKERPCPGCGNLKRMAPQTLCGRCRGLIRLGKIYEQETRRREDSDEVVDVAIGSDFAYGADKRRYSIRQKHTERAMLEQLCLLAKAENGVGTYEKAKPLWFKYSVPYNTRPDVFVCLPPEQAERIEVVLNYIAELSTKWYTRGFYAGRDILTRVATGGIDELNRMSIKGEKDD